MFAGCCPLRVLISWKRAKGYSTGYSQAVTHPSTNPACGCLTSEIERDRVHSTEYGRIQQIRLKHPYKIKAMYTVAVRSRDLESVPMLTIRVLWSC